MPRNVSRIALTSLFLLAMVAASLWLPRRADEVAAPAGTSALDAVPASGDASEVSGIEQPAELVSPESIADNTVEVAASRQMFLAHEPLRRPEVADPDSEANRQILETMVTKALSRAEQPENLPSKQAESP